MRRPGTLTNGGDKKILNKFGGSSITVDRHPAISNSHKYTTHHPAHILVHRGVFLPNFPPPHQPFNTPHHPAHILVHRGSILPNLTTPHQPFNTPHQPAHILVHRGSILPNLTSPHQPYYIPHHPAHILVHRGVFYQTSPLLIHLSIQLNSFLLCEFLNFPQVSSTFYDTQPFSYTVLLLPHSTHFF